MTAREVADFERCVAEGGVGVFPADTVYGLACDPHDADAIARMYELKGRAPDKPAATMWFDLARALAALPERADVLARLLPGAVTVVLPEGGVRVPALTGPLLPLRAVSRPVLQTSANHAGGADPRSLRDVPAQIRAAADVVLDAGPLPGTPSTVVDLRAYATTGEWSVLREGAVPAAALAQALSSDAR
ncbi:MAG TPA: Sua5/YciO/YrdC/YwlC family protein [Solirubrobacteraceae bacterium]|nr:Sua5/YciO/YrdC/YwlC family protein [Solirubrobacteraceae bacterium]